MKEKRTYDYNMMKKEIVRTISKYEELVYDLESDDELDRDHAVNWLKNARFSFGKPFSKIALTALYDAVNAVTDKNHTPCGLWVREVSGSDYLRDWENPCVRCTDLGCQFKV